jgi:hypothetical protein
MVHIEFARDGLAQLQPAICPQRCSDVRGTPIPAPFETLALSPLQPTDLGHGRPPPYLQPRLDLNVGDKTVTLENVSIFPTRVGSDLDELYGNLGQDVVAKFDSLTLDVRP